MNNIFNIKICLVSSVPNVEYSADKIETIYFTNNSIAGNTVEKKPSQIRNTSDSVFNTSFDFLQVNMSLIALLHNCLYSFFVYT